VANELRKYQNFVGGLVEDNPLTSGATTLTSAGLAAITNGVGSTEHMAIILDPDGLYGAPEVAHITALTAAATSATIARGREGTIAREHLRDIPWVHGPTIADIGTWSRRVRQTLTDKTSFAAVSTFEQWGTEEAVLDDALLPRLTNVTVFAQAVGYIENWTDTGNISTLVEISLDGGTTWDTGTSIFQRRAAGGQTSDRHPTMPIHQVTGTVTGDIQARAMASSATGAGATQDMKQGVLYMEVLL
jgi:hypothetical protein